MSEAAKQAYERFRFKHRICYKKCMLHESKGGFCTAHRGAIDYCLGIEKEESDNRNYRNVNTVVEWIEVFLEDTNITYLPNPTEIQKMLDSSRDDCYRIAERIVEAMNV